MYSWRLDALLLSVFVDSGDNAILSLLHLLWRKLEKVKTATYNDIWDTAIKFYKEIVTMTV